jgi:peptidyl-prolyl cis-trans isomerase SurA
MGNGACRRILAAFFYENSPQKLRGTGIYDMGEKMVRALATLVIGLVLAMGTALPAAAAVVATVGGTQITDVEVSQRVKLFQLEGRSGGNKAALEELIDEAIMLQEAKRLNIAITEQQVDQAFQNVARNIKVSVENLNRILSQNGVNADTLRSRLRAALAWNQVTTIAVMPRIQISDVDLEQQAAAKLDASMSYDYILKEVLFVMPGGKGNASQRTSQANQYRKNFQGCDSAVQLSLSYTDAAVIDVGRRHATQLPEPIAKELAGLNVGGLTKPRVVETGVSMLAVCAKSVAEDTTFVKSTLRQEAGNKQLEAEQKAYLAELRERAKIIYE